MSNAIANDFQKYWEKFSAQLRGQLMNQAKNGTLHNTTAKLALSGSVAFWDDRYAEGRKWLDRLEQEQPEKAQLVQDILLKDMGFQDLEEQKDHSPLLKYGIPVGGAIVGFAVSRFLGSTATTQALWTAGVALVSYPAASGMAGAVKDTAVKRTIDAYMDQLDKYRLSVEGVLKP